MRVCVCPQVEEAEAGDPVLHGHHHHVILGGQHPGVVQVQADRAAVEAPTVYPHLAKYSPLKYFLLTVIYFYHDGDPLHPAGHGPGHLQVQAVLAEGAVGHPHLHPHHNKHKK